MKKKSLLFGALVGALLLSSYSGGSKRQTVSSENTEELDDASKVVNYCHMSLAISRHVANAKDIDAVLGHVEQTGRVPKVEPIAPPKITAHDTAELLDPGNYFNPETRQSLKQNYAGLFNMWVQFYDNFNKFPAYKKLKGAAKAAQFLDENYRLSIELPEYKQATFDILSPLAEQVESELLADEPLRGQITVMRRMLGTVQSIMNLYFRKRVVNGVRIDSKMAESEEELKVVEKIPAVTGYDEELKSSQNLLSTVKSFMSSMQKAGNRGAYSDRKYQVMSEAYEYGLSVI